MATSHHLRPHLKSGTYFTLIRILSVCKDDLSHHSNSIPEFVPDQLQLGKPRDKLHSQPHDKSVEEGGSYDFNFTVSNEASFYKKMPDEKFERTAIHDVELSQALSMLENELEQMIQPTEENDAVERYSLTLLNDSLNHIEDQFVDDKLEDPKTNSPFHFIENVNSEMPEVPFMEGGAPLDNMSHIMVCNAINESSERAEDKQCYENKIEENENLCSFVEKVKGTLNKEAANSAKVNYEGDQKLFAHSLIEKSNTKEGECSLDEFEEGEIPFVDSFVDLNCDTLVECGEKTLEEETSEKVTPRPRHVLNNPVVIGNSDNVFDADRGDMMEVEENNEKFYQRFSENKRYDGCGGKSENGVFKMKCSGSEESRSALVDNNLDSDAPFECSDSQLIKNERRVSQKPEGGISPIQEAENLLGTEKETDKEINRKPRGKISEKRKEKRKIQKRKSRAEKNRKLGVKRLKLPPIMTKKPVTICNNFIKGRCQKGEECRYSHDAVPLTKSKPCCHLARQACMKGEKCPFDHDLSKYPCNNFLSSGFCSRGDECLFSHKVPEAGKIVPTVSDIDSNSKGLKPDVSILQNGGSSFQTVDGKGSLYKPRARAPSGSSEPKKTEPFSVNNNSVVGFGLNQGEYAMGPPPKGISLLSFSADRFSHTSVNPGLNKGSPITDRVPAVDPHPLNLNEGSGINSNGMNKENPTFVSPVALVEASAREQKNSFMSFHRPLLSTLKFAAECESRMKARGDKGFPSDGSRMNKALEIFDILYKKKALR